MCSPRGIVVLLATAMLVSNAAGCSNNTFAAPSADRPPIAQAKNPKSLDQPLVITKPGVFRLKQDYRASGTAIVVAAPDVTLEGNGHVIEFNTAGKSGAAGIHLYAGEWSALDKPLGKLANAREAKKVVIRNAVIRQSKQTGEKNTGIVGYRANGAQIERCTIEVGGRDSHAIHFQFGSTTITRCTLLNHQTATGNRHQGPATVRAPRIKASGNVLWGGNSGFNCREPGSIISGNVIAHHSYATNGYGVWLYQPDQVKVTNNVLLPLNGRGILVNGGNSSAPDRGNRNTLQGNVILAWNRPNNEYGDRLNAAGIRVRYRSSENVVRNNFILGVGGGDYAGASGFYLSSTKPHAESALTENTIYAMLLGKPSRTRYAKSLTMEGHANSCQYKIDHNHFFSNHFLISLSGYDGAGQQDRPMVGNALNWCNGTQAATAFREAVEAKLIQIGLQNNHWARWLADNAYNALKPLEEVGIQSRRKTIYSAHWRGDESITLLNTTGQAGLELSNVLVQNKNYPGSRRIEVGRQLRVQLVKNGAPLTGKSVEVKTSDDRTLNVHTDTKGFADVPIIEYWLGRESRDENRAYQAHANDTMIITVDRFKRSLAVDTTGRVVNMADGEKSP